MSGLRGRRRSPDPFAALGLTARPDLTDDDVRAAWRRVAAATHPDRQDGGDPERFAAAAAAYTELRTRFGRGEALAEAEPGRRGVRLRGGKAGTGHDAAGTAGGGGRTVADPGAAQPADSTGRGRGTTGTGTGASAPGGQALATEGSVTAGSSWRLPVAAARIAARVRRGRPARLALRVLAAVAASTAAVAVAGAQPAGPALVTGAVTWLALTARQDLAPPAG